MGKRPRQQPKEASGSGSRGNSIGQGLRARVGSCSGGSWFNQLHPSWLHSTVRSKVHPQPGSMSTQAVADPCVHSLDPPIATPSLGAGCPITSQQVLPALSMLHVDQVQREGAAETTGLELRVCGSLARSGASLGLNMLSSSPQGLIGGWGMGSSSGHPHRQAQC